VQKCLAISLVGFFFQTLPISDMFLQFSLFHSRREIKCARESILKATHRLSHVSFLKRKVEEKKREKEYRAVKRTNLPSTRSVESLVATVFSRISSFFSFYVSNSERFYVLFKQASISYVSTNLLDEIVNSTVDCKR